jgi:WD40 repeat protein
MSTRFVAVLSVFLIPLTAFAQPAVDKYGFPLPAGAIARLGNLRFAQPDRITAIAQSTDGKLIATGFRDRAKENSAKGELLCQVLLWDAETGRTTGKIPIDEIPDGLAFFANNKLLAVRVSNGTLTIFDIESGKARQKLKGAQCFRRWKFRFLDEDRILVLEGQDRVEVWDLAKGTLLKDWVWSKMMRPNLPEDLFFRSASLSPSGKRMAWLAMSSRAPVGPCEVTVFDTLSRNIIQTCKIDRSVTGIGLIDEGDTVLLRPDAHSESDRLTNVVYDLKNGRELSRFLTRPNSADRFLDVCQLLGSSPDGKWLYVGDLVGTRCFEVATGKLLGELPDSFRDLAISDDGKRVLGARGARLYWHDAHLKLLNPEADLSEAMVRYRADGKLMAQERSGRRLNIWDPVAGKVIERLELSPFPDDRQNRGLFQLTLIRRDKDGLAVHDRLTNRELCRLENTKEARFFELCPDGNRVLATVKQKTEQIACWYDAKTGKQLGSLTIANDELLPRSVEQSSVEWLATDGSAFGYAGRDRRLTVVDCATKTKTKVGVEESDTYPRFLLNQSRGVAHGQFNLTYLPHSLSAVEFTVMDQKTGQRMRHVTVCANWYFGFYCNIHLTPDGRSFWQRNKAAELCLYESATGRLRGRLPTEVGFDTFHLAPDGKTLAISCLDSSILIFYIDRPLSDRPKLPAPTSAEEAEKLWQALADPDPAAMEPALWVLVRAPKYALPLFKQRLQPAPAPNLELVRKAIDQLDSSDFKQRATAMHELAKAPELAIPALQAALKNGPSLEQKRRIEELLVTMESEYAVPSRLRELRAIEALERIGTSAARELIAILATGHPDAHLTREARSVLSRLQR